jgi:hypothetical protein
MNTLLRATALAALPIMATACTPKIETNNRVEVAPIEIKPIHITMDINLRIDRSLDEFFNFQKPAAGTPAVVVPVPATIPATPGMEGK